MGGAASVPVRFADGTEAFRCDPADTLLLAGLRAGWDMPYECASGGCGMCKVRLVDGQVDCLWPDATGLQARDHRRGDRILLCQSRPATGCTIRPLAPVGRADDAVPPPSRRPVVLVGRETLSEDTLLLTLDCGRPAPYLAGQYLVLELPDGTRRAYSMSREPSSVTTGRLEVLVRRKPDGRASSWFFDRASVGDRLLAEGPYGRAHAQSPVDRPVLCVGGGSGLGAVLAIAEHCLTEFPDRPVTLFAGARHEADVVLADRMAVLRGRGAEVVTALDRRDGTAARADCGPVHTGRVVDVLADLHEDLTGHDLYAAGPSGMIDALRTTVVRPGRARADRVFFDTFIA